MYYSLEPLWEFRSQHLLTEGKGPKRRKEGRDWEQGPARHWFAAAAFPSTLLSPPSLGLLCPLVEALPLGTFASSLTTVPSRCETPLSLHLCQFIKRKRRYLARISSVVSRLFDIKACLQTFLFLGSLALLCNA